MLDLNIHKFNNFLLKIEVLNKKISNTEKLK